VPRRLSTKAVTPEEPTGEVVVFPSPVKAKNPAAQALGRLGGSKGGTIRAQRLSTEEKVAIARQGAQARWAKARIRKEAEASASRREGGSERG
jgi:hypothetical protein